MRKKEDGERSLGGSELALLEEETWIGREFGIIVLPATRCLRR